MAWIETAGGIALPPPELGSCGVTISTMVDGARNGNGDFIGQVVGDDKLKIEVSFGMLTPSEMQTLLSLFDRKRGGKFINTFRVFDPRVNDFVYMDMWGTGAVRPSVSTPHGGFRVHGKASRRI